MSQQFEHIRRRDILPTNDELLIDPHRDVSIPDGMHMDALFDEAGIEVETVPKAVGVVILHEQAIEQDPVADITYNWTNAPSADFDPTDPHHSSRFDWLIS